MTDTEGHAGQSADAGKVAREEEATSQETLADLRSEESGSTMPATGGAASENETTERATPSPDGAFDSSRGGGSDAGGPM